MSKKKNQPNGAAASAAPTTEGSSTGAPSISVESQFLREASITSLTAKDRENRKPTAPQVRVGVEIGVNPLTQKGKSPANSQRFEVSLTTEAKATTEADSEESLFDVRVVYSGVFLLANLNEQQRTFALGVEAPRILFPFVRHLISNLTRDSGFPPVTLDNVDFADILRQRLANEKQQDAGKAASDTPSAEEGKSVN